MIHCLYGKLGAGKGLVSMDILEREIVSGYRDIVTNLPLRLTPWVNGAGEPQLGLLAYLKGKYGETFDAEHRIKVIEEDDEQQLMFLWRRHPETNEWFQLKKIEKSGVCVGFSAEEVKDIKCRPVLVINDEAWKHFPVKAFGRESSVSVQPVVEFYGRQQRKLSDEWWLVTQHHDDLHHVFARIAQDHTVVRNHGMERLGIFRQPQVFRTQQYTQQPKGAARPRCETMFRLDRKGLAQCYDTSAGVGISGGFAADRKRKDRGVNIIWLGVAILLLVVGLALVPTLMSKGAGHIIGNMIGSTKNMVPPAMAQAKAPAPGVPAPVPVQQVAQAPVDLGPVLNTNVFVSGFARVNPSKLMIFLTDGQAINAPHPSLTEVSDTSIVWRGVRYLRR